MVVAIYVVYYWKETLGWGTIQHSAFITLVEYYRLIDLEGAVLFVFRSLSIGNESVLVHMRGCFLW